jgi:hypothetical protein
VLPHRVVLDGLVGGARGEGVVIPPCHIQHRPCVALVPLVLHLNSSKRGQIGTRPIGHTVNETPTKWTKTKGQQRASRPDDVHPVRPHSLC